MILPSKAVYRPQLLLQNIPTHLIAGGLGAGKTTLIQQWLKQKPSHERWAILINEFGRVGLDAALLGEHEQVHVLELSGGCLCCVNGVPFRTALGQLLRQTKPDRVLIEPSGLGHPQRLLTQLKEDIWRGVLSIQPVVLVVDACAWFEHALPEAQAELLPQAGLIVLSKGRGLTRVQKSLLESQLGAGVWSDEDGGVPLSDLPGFCVQTERITDSDVEAVVLESSASTEVSEVQIQLNESPSGWSMGWQWPAHQVFDQAKMQACLEALPWMRAKLVVRFEQGWCSANASAGSRLHFKASEWRKDSRLEVIFQTPQNAEYLQTLLAECLL